MTRRLASIALLSAAWISCGDPAAEPATPAAVTHRTIEGPPRPAAPPEREAIPVSAAVERLGGSLAGTMLAATGEGVYELAGRTLERRTLYASGADPTAMGAVRAIAARRQGGAWLGADAGLYMLEGQYLTRTPLLPEAGKIHAAADSATGALGGLWIAGENGLFRRRAGVVERFRLSSIDGAATAVALEDMGASAFVVVGGKLVRIAAEGGALLSELPPFETGAVAAVAGGAATLYAATEQGLVRWTASAKPAWSRFTLAAAGAPATGVRAVAVDLPSQMAWLATDRLLVRLDGDVAAGIETPAPGAGRRPVLGIDSFGDVFLAGADGLVRWKTGAAPASVGFDRQLGPWISANCARCHADFTSPAVFAARAEAAWGRVRTGDMPRCTGGVPCPPGMRLGPADIAILEGWIRGGKQP